MDKSIKDIRVKMQISAMYGNFYILVENTHGNKLLHTVSEKHYKDGWKDVPFSASEYILEDFKKTSEYKEMLDIINIATTKYGR